jgi:hypothetical protein
MLQLHHRRDWMYRWLCSDAYDHLILRLKLSDLDLPPGQTRALIERVEMALHHQPLEFTGRLVGPDEAAFYLVAERRQLELAVEGISQAVGLSPEQLLVEEEPGSSDEEADPCQRRPRLFDVWAVPLATGGFGHLQVLAHHEDFLDLVRVFDAVTPSPLSREQVLGASLMFPPVFTLVSTKTAKANGLHFLGNAPVQFQYPTFRHANLAMLYPEQFDSDWCLWTFENGYQFVGFLSEEQLDLEALIQWPLQDIAKRIAKRIGAKDALARFAHGSDRV